MCVRKTLKFLEIFWQKDGDFSKEPIDHKICAHVFGGVSSGACSTDVLKRTAKESEKNIYVNLYVDDLLKSVTSEDDAIKLMKNVRSLCSEGGFNLTNSSVIRGE